LATTDCHAPRPGAELARRVRWDRLGSHPQHSGRPEVITMKKLTIVKLEKRIAPRYVPF
jgi:hypothetical protein